MIFLSDYFGGKDKRFSWCLQYSDFNCCFTNYLKNGEIIYMKLRSINNLIIM